MRSLFLLAFVLLVLVTPLFAQNLLNNPESVVWDGARNRYLVSNVGSGHIVAYTDAENQELFSDALEGNWAIGMFLHNGTLYCAVGNGDMAGVAAFDPAIGEMTAHYNVEGDSLLNDIAFDSNGMLYVTDYWGSKLYRINPADSTSVIVAGAETSNPNGCTYDAANNRILFCANSGIGRPIRAFNIDDSTVTNVVNTNQSGMDGLVFDLNGNLYFSSWGPDAIYRMDAPDFDPIWSYSSGHNDPADIYFDSTHVQIVVPNYSGNSLDFVPVLDNEVKSETDRRGELPGKLDILNSYPNPVNGVSTLKYAVSENSDINIEIFDVLGRCIFSNIAFNESGTHLFQWNLEANDGTTVPSGIYFAQISNEQNDKCSTQIHVIR